MLMNAVVSERQASRRQKIFRIADAVRGADMVSIFISKPVQAILVTK